MNSASDNLRLFEKKFAILQEISNALVVTDNLSAIANLMLDLAINYTKAEKGSLMLVNERDELYILAGRGIDLNLIRTYRAKIGQGIAGIVAKNRAPMLVQDLEEEPQLKGLTRDRYRTNSFVSCPIISKNRLLGVININDKVDGASFNDDEFSLIKIIANQAAIALENAMLVSQLRFKAAELEGINRKLIESDVVKTEFITRVSHELRTPLNSIKGSVYYLSQSERLSRREQEEFYDIITGETDKLIGIVENQLDFLRFEDETMIINKTVVSLREVLGEISNSKNIKTLFARKDINLKIEVDEGLSDIVGDRIRIMQFFLNILEGLNSYLERGDEIVISARENDQVHISIALPRRLPESITAYLFSSNHLFQTDSPEGQLKLYLARKVSDIHRWDLVAENTADGLLITLNIPKSTRQKMDAVVTTTIDMFLEFITEVLDVNICSVMLCDDLTGDLMIKGARGLDDLLIKQTRVRMGERIAGWVALEGEPLFVEDIEQDPRFGRKNVAQYNSKSLISLPLKINGKVIGVLNLNNKRSSSPFTERDFDLAQSMCERVVHVIEGLYGEERQEDEFRQLMTSFDSLISAEKKYHKKDSRLPDVAMGMAAKLGLGEQERRSILYASVLYDLGLVLLEESILSKKGKLLPTEENTLKIHPYTTVGLLDSFEFSEEIKQGILHHHERYDGTGYPDGLNGNNIPFIARILAVVDAYCAMTSERPYRPAMEPAEALAEIRKKTGTYYDPQMVDVLEQVVS
ncbi:HD domain-containing phosphohydrolase [Geobacter benzoatilyticus]|uniref:histidine kinase n=1 Tax=Geobacter benzoatilyticus TaxID=2815309 RepID=A0ABX7Q1R3_9BACT|nr:HD domain-containing phosphohydrolase [Geobacter benzoatilyticus]QSV45051.1 GAF domain-containing protein [Geobacter benzoatilyticus]